MGRLELKEHNTTAKFFDVELFLKAFDTEIGRELDLINLDIRKSTIKGVQLLDSQYGQVNFDALESFDAWQSADDQFGNPLNSEKSEITLDGFFLPDPPAPRLLDGQDFRVGVFRFDYSGLSLASGDKIVLDITGQDVQGGFPSTSVVTSEPNMVPNTTLGFGITFESSYGPSSIEVTVENQGGPGVIPEPSSALVFTGVIMMPSVFVRRRRKRTLALNVR